MSELCNSNEVQKGNSVNLKNLKKAVGKKNRQQTEILRKT